MMQSFNEAMASIGEKAACSILLANGFSQAWNADIFNYRNLLEAADFGERQGVLLPLFDAVLTFDFEKIMNHLVATERVLTIYNADQNLIGQIQRDKETLKEALIAAISRTHPDLPH